MNIYIYQNSLATNIVRCVIIKLNRAYVKLFDESASKIPFLDVCILPHLSTSKINLELIDNVSCLNMTPWTLSTPTATFRFDLTK